MQQTLPLDSVSTSITPGAFRDTIAAIVRDAAYSRSATQSYWDRALRWMLERVEAVLEALRASDVARYLTIGALVVLGVLIIARIVLGVRDEELVRSGRTRERTTETGGASIAEAERLAAAGDFTAAAHALFAALLAMGAARGEIRLHPSKTTGDYARELRRKNASWQSAFAQFRSRYDRVIYGDVSCSPSDYEWLAREARSALETRRAA